MKKVLGTILFVIYAIIAITVTVLLLSYNDYNNSVIGEYTIYIVTDDSLEPEYKQGSILLIKETNDKNVQIGDEVFMYKVLNSSEYEVINTTLQAKTQQGRHNVYIVDDEESYASDYFIGKVEDTIVIEGWGYILNILESKWGYLFCIVVVSLLLFLQEVFELVMEIKYLNQQKKKNAIEIESEEYYDEEEYEEEEYDEEEYEEPVVKTRKTSPKTNTATRTNTKTRTTAKTSTARKTGTTTKTCTTKTTGTTTKTSTAKGTGATVKTSTTKRTGATTKTSTAKGTGATTKTSTAKRTGTTTKASTATKTGTTRKTSTATATSTRKPRATKSSKEE